MINNLKALVVVMVIAVIVFAVARPLCLRFMAEADFVRRRNIWFALTITAFVSPSFWMFAAVALPLVAWGAHKDPNPLALYVLVYCIIPISIKVEIPIGGINALFGMGQQRILAFAILIPVAWRLLFSGERKGTGRLTTVDLFVLAYIGLSAVQLWPVSETTQFMRWGFLKFLDVILLYYVALRACGTRKAIVEVMAIYCLLCAVVAPLALFESQRHWLLYTELGKIWGDPIDFAYVSRAGNLRAQVTAGQSIPLGYVLAFGFGIWLYLSSHVNSRFWTIAYGVLMWAGMFAAGARAPWVAAVAIFFTFLILGPNATARFWKASLVSVLFAGVMLLSPLGGRIIDRLPFIGKVEQENVVYRQQLAAVSWEVVKQYPFFGDMYFERHLQSLRQGEGIIDLVNTYANISMSRGLIGLFLYLAPYLIALRTAFRLSRRAARLDPDLSLLGAVLFACLFGSLLAMGMGGFGPAPDTFAIVVIGLSVTCSRLGIGKEATQVRPPRQTRAQPQWTMKRG